MVSGLNELINKGACDRPEVFGGKHLISFYEVIGDYSTFSFAKC